MEIWEGKHTFMVLSSMPKIKLHPGSHLASVDGELDYLDGHII